LSPDGTILIDIVCELFPRRPGSCKIQHSALQEAQKEILLIKVEKTEIEDVVQSQSGVTNPDRVMSESLPVDLTRAVGDQPNLRFVTWQTIGRKCGNTTENDQQDTCQPEQKFS
jgi:hypothetical protein